MMEMLHAQTCQNFEVILIDNASSDNSREVLNQLGESSKLKCSVICNNENIGLCRAFNQGLAIATGKYVIDLSPDDYFLPEKLERNFSLLEQENAKMLFSNCLIIKEDESILHSEKYSFNYEGKGNYFFQILASHCLASCTGVYDRRMMVALGGYNENLAYEDFDFMTRASLVHELVYDDLPIMEKGERNKGWSAQFGKRSSVLHESTYRICKSLRDKCGNQVYSKAYNQRVWAELKNQLKLLNCHLVIKYMGLFIIH